MPLKWYGKQRSLVPLLTFACCLAEAVWLVQEFYTPVGRHCRCVVWAAMPLFRTGSDGVLLHLWVIKQRSWTGWRRHEMQCIIDATCILEPSIELWYFRFYSCIILTLCNNSFNEQWWRCIFICLRNFWSSISWVFFVAWCMYKVSLKAAIDRSCCF